VLLDVGAALGVVVLLLLATWLRDRVTLGEFDGLGEDDAL